MNIEKRVCIIVSEVLGAEDVVPTANLVEDLHADSLDEVELLMAIEEEFDIHCEISDIKTVADIIAYVRMAVADAEMQEA